MSKPITEETILDALRAVKDPDLHRDIVTLNMIRDVKVCGGNASFRFVLTTPACPVRDQLKDEARRAVLAIPGVKTMSIGLLNPGDKAVVWRGPMLHSAVAQFLRQVEWGELDYLVVDMPPGTGDVQLSLAQLVPLAGAVLVTTPQEVALSDVRKALRMFEAVNVPVLGVVENMSYFVAPDTGARYNIFGEGGGQKLADEYGVPLLGA